MSDTSIPSIYGTGGGYEVKTPYEDADSKQVSVDDFLQLMIAQLKNQDFTNPVDDTQYVTQLAQFASMQQMQELAYYSKTNYVMSLVGKDVTAASMGLGGNVHKVTGPVEKVVLSNKEFMIFVEGKGYKLNQIMEVIDPVAVSDGDLSKVPKMAVVLEYARDDSAKIRWDPATTDEERQKEMTYSVYYTKQSEDNTFDTVNKVKTGTLVGTANTPNIYSQEIDGLEPDTTYVANVVVKSPSGKEEIYEKLIFTTKS